MIKEYIEKFRTNKHLLREYFASTDQNEYGDYLAILKKIIEICIYEKYTDDEFDTDRITEIDDGDYSGTLLYLIPRDMYEPAEYDYLTTWVDYGSCCVCDTLQAIQSRSSNYKSPWLPTEKQVDEYMTLALHMVEHMEWFRGGNK